MNKNIWVFALCFLPFFNPAAFADDSTVIVVSASKIEENQEDSIEKVQVVTGEDIEKSGAKKKADYFNKKDDGIHCSV